MHIVKATLDKLASINELVKTYGMNPMIPDFLNGRDIAIIAVENKKVIGLVWAGLMANQKLAYIDYFLVHPDYAGKNVSEKLGKQLVKVCNKKGVDLVLGHIEQDVFIEKALSDAIKIGFEPSPTWSVGVKGKISHMLINLGVN